MKNNLEKDRKVKLKAEIVDLIIKKYGSQTELARVMGITEGNLSNKLGRLSNKFLSQLESYGVYQKPRNEVHKNKFTAIINEDSKDEITKLKYRIKELESRLKDKEEIIELLKGKGA